MRIVCPAGFVDEVVGCVCADLARVPASVQEAGCLVWAARPVDALCVLLLHC